MPGPWWPNLRRRTGSYRTREAGAFPSSGHSSRSTTSAEATGKPVRSKAFVRPPVSLSTVTSGPEPARPAAEGSAMAAPGGSAYDRDVQLVAGFDAQSLNQSTPGGVIGGQGPAASPTPYRARISRACARSRSGAAPSISLTSAVARSNAPRHRSASAWSSTHAIRCSWMAACHAARVGPSGTSANAGPRHNANPSPNRAAATGRSPAAIAAGPALVSCRHRGRSNSTPERSIRYPAPRLASTGPAGVSCSIRRSPDAYERRLITAEEGGRFPHSSSRRSDTGTTLPARTSSSASTSRCFGDPNGSGWPTSTSSAPRTRTCTSTTPPQ